MQKPHIDLQNYQRLAAAVVEIAAADYVEAMIVIQHGGVLTAQQRSSARKKRAMFKDKQQGERAMQMYIDHCYITNLTKAEIEAENCLRFFYSPLFAMFMPHTDPNAFVDRLTVKAEGNEMIDSGYDSFLKHKGGWADD